MFVQPLAPDIPWPLQAVVYMVITPARPAELRSINVRLVICQPAQASALNLSTVLTSRPYVRIVPVLRQLI